MSNAIYLKCGEIGISFIDAGPAQPSGPVSLQFPGGFVEVAPNADGSFWAQVHVVKPSIHGDAHLYFFDGRHRPECEAGSPIRHVALRVVPEPSKVAA